MSNCTNGARQNTNFSTLAISNFTSIRRSQSVTQAPCVPTPTTPTIIEPLPKQLSLYQKDFNAGPVILENHENYEIHIMEDINFAAGWNTPARRYLYSLAHRNVLPNIPNLPTIFKRLPIVGWSAAIYIISSNVTVYLNDHTITLAEDAPHYAFSAWNPIQFGNQVFSILQFPIMLADEGSNLLGHNTSIRDPDDYLKNIEPINPSYVRIFGPGSLQGTHSGITAHSSFGHEIRNLELSGWVQGIFLSTCQDTIVENCRWSTLNVIPAIHLNMAKAFFISQNLSFALAALRSKPDNHELRDLFGNLQSKSTIINIFNYNLNTIKTSLFAPNAKQLYLNDRPTEIWLSNIRNNVIYPFRHSRFHQFENNIKGAPIYDSIINNTTNLLGINTVWTNNTVENSIFANNGIANQKISMINKSANGSFASMGGTSFFSQYDLNNILNEDDSSQITTKTISLHIEIANATLAFYYPNFLNNQYEESPSIPFAYFPNQARVSNFSRTLDRSTGSGSIVGGNALSSGELFRADASNNIKQDFEIRFNNVKTNNQDLSMNFPGTDISNQIGSLELLTFAISTINDGSGDKVRLIDHALQTEFNAQNDASGTTGIVPTVFSTLGIDGNRNQTPNQLFYFNAQQNLQQINSRVNNIVAININTYDGSNLLVSDPSAQRQRWDNIVSFDEAIRVIYRDDEDGSVEVINRIRDGSGIYLPHNDGIPIDFSNEFLASLKDISINTELPDGSELGTTSLKAVAQRVQRSYDQDTSGTISFRNSASGVIDDNNYYANSIICNNYVSIANGNVNGSQNTSISNFNPNSININMIDTWRFELTDNSYSVTPSFDTIMNPPQLRPNGRLDTSDNETHNFMIRGSIIHKPTEYRLSRYLISDNSLNLGAFGSRQISTALPETSKYANTKQADLSYQNFVVAYDTILNP